VADPVTLTAAARYVYGAFSLFGGGLSGAERRALEASGARPAPRGLSIDGRRVSQSEAIAAGRAVLARTPVLAPTPAPAPVPGRPYATPADVLREVLNRNPTYNPGTRPGLPPTVPEFEDLLRRPSPDIGTRNPTTWNPNSPARIPRAGPASAISVLARAAGLLGGLLYPTVLGDSDLGYESRSNPEAEPPDPRRAPRQRYRNRRQPDPQRPPLGQTIADRLPSPSARPVSTSLPRSEPRPVPIGTPQPSPFPQPLPAPSATAVPRPLSVPLPLLFPLPQPRPSTRPGRTPDTMSPLVPGGSIASPDRLSMIDRQGRPLTAPQPQPLALPSGGGSDPCSCSRTSKPKRKRKPRNECWRGTYVETRAGLSKTRKEKIPCQ